MLIKTADCQLRKAQTRYKRYFNARRRRTFDVKVNPGDSVFVNATLANHPHWLATIGSWSFPVTVVDTHIFTFQRSINSAKKISRIRALRTLIPQEDDNHVTQHQPHDRYGILNLPCRLRTNVFTPHGSSFLEDGTGSKPARLDGSVTALRDI